MRPMSDFENAYIKGKSLHELIDALPKTTEPGSAVHETMKAAIHAKMVEQIAKPQKWAGVALGAAVVSSLAAVASAIAAFS
jgi:hypothetical protein